MKTWIYLACTCFLKYPSRRTNFLHNTSMNTLVFQSYKTTLPVWIQQCQQSVFSWSKQNKYDYAFVGDDIFSLCPSWFHEKLGNRMPIRSDLARLLYTRHALQFYDRVVWFDIDCFIFAPRNLILKPEPYTFGQERWVQPHKKNGWKIYKNVCNAFFQFQRENSFLDFYIETAQKMIRRVDKQYIAPQMIGPKLLTAIHNIVQLPITTMVGSASPWLIQECAQRGGPLLQQVKQSIDGDRCAAVNLCSSLFENEPVLLDAISFLHGHGPI